MNPELKIMISEIDSMGIILFMDCAHAAIETGSQPIEPYKFISLFQLFTAAKINADKSLKNCSFFTKKQSQVQFKI